jgi:hypothetical protein
MTKSHSPGSAMKSQVSKKAVSYILYLTDSPVHREPSFKDSTLLGLSFTTRMFRLLAFFALPMAPQCAQDCSSCALAKPADCRSWKNWECLGVHSFVSGLVVQQIPRLLLRSCLLCFTNFLNLQGRLWICPLLVRVVRRIERVQKKNKQGREAGTDPRF